MKDKNDHKTMDLWYMPGTLFTGVLQCKNLCAGRRSTSTRAPQNSEINNGDTKPQTDQCEADTASKTNSTA